MAAATGATPSATCLRASNAQAYYSVKAGEVLVRNVHASTWEFGGKEYHVVAYKNPGVTGKSYCQVLDGEMQLDGNDPDAMIVRKGLTEVLFIGHKDRFNRLKNMNWSNVAEALNAKATEVLSKAVVDFATRQEEEHASVGAYASIATEKPDLVRRGSVFEPGEVLETLREEEAAEEEEEVADEQLRAAPLSPEAAAPQEQAEEESAAELAAKAAEQAATEAPAESAPAAVKKSLAQRVTSYCNQTTVAVIAGIAIAWIISRV
ncbi:MAG: hypothetical protein JXA94_06685 [Parachlamydiales bacterium]|nr:hypothetical protein [Parachlamydiales bacterium]